MRREFRVPGTNYVFQTIVSPGQIINPQKYWRRYLRGRRNPTHVARLTKNGEPQLVK